MRNKTKLPNIYLAIVMCLMYLPILLVIIFSFNESKITSVWAGFSLRWYKELFNDAIIMKSLYISLVIF